VSHPQAFSSPRNPLLSHSQHPHASFLQRLPPLPPNPQQTTHCPRKPHNPIIQLDPAQRTRRDRNITHITQQLDLHRIELLRHFLGFNDLLRVGGGEEGFLAEAEVVVGVETGCETEGEAGEPCAVGFAQEAGCGGEFVDGSCVQLYILSALNAFLDSVVFLHAIHPLGLAVSSE
jgi:hypothetical protein